MLRSRRRTVPPARRIMAGGAPPAGTAPDGANPVPATRSRTGQCALAPGWRPGPPAAPAQAGTRLAGQPSQRPVI